MNKIKNIQDLKNRKTELKSEISEIESILSFENPRKSFGVITDGATEKYLGGIINSGISKNILPILGKAIDGSIKLGSAKLINNMAKKVITRSTISKGIIGISALIATPFLIKKAKKAINEYQRREATKGLSKLI